jgi:hypothetical protein
MRKRSSVLAATIVGATALGASAQLFTPSAFAQPSPTPSNTGSGATAGPSPGPSSGAPSAPSPAPSLRTPNTAGGLPRDAQAESQLGQDINADRNKIIVGTNGRFNIVSAFYRDPSETTSDSRPAGVIFIGGTGVPYSIDPAQFVASFRQGALPNPASEVDAGPGGGKAVCSQDTVRGQVGAYCAWATGNTFGLIMPTFDKGIPTVAALMRKMRPDLQGSG